MVELCQITPKNNLSKLHMWIYRYWFMHINKIISINKILFLEFMTESFRECKFDIKYVNTVKSTTQWVRVKVIEFLKQNVQK